MTRIKSLTLSNFRRFGRSSTIHFSPGATVLLAPNGTGKTAVFEAIELALTGGVARLGEDLTPLIREGADQAEVQLAFEEGEFRVQLPRLGTLRSEGDSKSVFGDTDPADLPYLLRLTHLLDQREKAWFVQADPKEAGSQLAKLPIGRDGAMANAVLSSARRNLKEQLNQTLQQVTQDAATLEEWTRLLQERDAFTSEQTRPLKSQGEISEALIEVARSVDHTPFATPRGLEGLDTSRSVLHEAVVSTAQRVDARFGELSKLGGALESFNAERGRVARLEQERVSAVAAADAERKVCHRLTLSLTQQVERLREVENLQKEVGRQVQRMQEAAAAKSHLDKCSHDLTEAGKELSAAEADLRDSRQRKEALDQLQQDHDKLNARRNALYRQEDDLREARLRVERWRQLGTDLVAVEQRLEAAHEQVQKAGDTYQTAIAEQGRRERTEAEFRSRFHSLSDATDAMRQAVSMVAASLPPDRSDCPVCGTLHGADVLRERVKSALEKLDPSLIEAEASLHAARQALEESAVVTASARSLLQERRGKVSELESTRAELTAQIDQIRTSHLLGGDSLESASVILDGRFSQLQAAIDDLERQRQEPAPLVTEEVEGARVAFDRASRRLERARTALGEVRNELARATQLYASLSVDAEPAEALPDLFERQVSIAQEIKQIEVSLQSDRDQLSQLQVHLKHLDEGVISCEQQLVDARSRMATLRAAWHKLDLPGDPSQEVASAIALELEAERANLARKIAVLEDLNGELASWRRAEANRHVQSLLDRRRGQATEQEMTAQLTTRVSSGEATVYRLSQLSTAMDSLSARLEAEIGNIHDHVVAMVPRWQALLRRVVRDQRFAETDLNVYSHYKKEHASVLVPLHGAQVPVPAVASEAQMTDLQFTFLLSMALNHRWSPWRALLLDDPTQHHDMVHAASVFDLLRDYIAESGFQVVIATHDALQARFFMRKLQNDGIPSQLWSLTPGAHGVTASPMK